MRLLYQLFMSFLFLGSVMLSGNVQADCCNAGFSVNRILENQNSNSCQFRMNDSVATDIQYVQWDFGNGSYSNERAPMQVYTNAGHYSVKLTVYKMAQDGVQKICTELHAFIIESNPCSDFSYAKSGRSVSFTQIAAFDIDSASSWAASRTFFWTFGDGQTSNAQNPTHIYAQPGTYTACLYQHKKDSAFVDSCYACQTVIIRDTIINPCTADFTYAVNDSMVTAYAVNQTGLSSWWIQGDSTTYQYGNQAYLPMFEDTMITICHRQYVDSIGSQYCEKCIIVTRPPRQNCNADFTYSLTESSIALHAKKPGYVSYWWLETNGVHSENMYSGIDTLITVPASGELTVCHVQYSNAYGDSCMVCKVVRSAPQDSIPPVPCHADFDYVVIGNTVTVYADSLNSGMDFWNFGNDSIRQDSSVANYTFAKPGTKRICHTRVVYNNSVADSCVSCKDIVIERTPITVHPNPAVHTIHVKTEQGLLSSIHIYNINGVEVKNVIGLNVDRYAVNVSHLSSGMYYILVVLVDGRISRTSIIIQ